MNAHLKEELAAGKSAELLAAFPEPSSSNGLPVDVATVLETGLVKTLCRPWNKRGAAG